MATREAVVHIKINGIEEFKAKIAGLMRILADRERELLELKGPCSNGKCGLHYAHSGPCDGSKAAEA